MRRVLYDLNVLLDVLLRREPFVRASAAALDSVTQQGTEGFLAGHAVTTLFYILRRNVGPEEAHELLAHLLARLKVAPVTDAGVREALARKFKDFEDAVTVCAAQEVEASVIVTRNPADFARSPVPAVLPEVFVIPRA
ncbi:MAG: PIN domain-containing protein [Deltaproteobacteria bacterium]|nr:PIN domain-containing protein [Deltaproteobacteria bacterium]